MPPGDRSPAHLVLSDAAKAEFLDGFLSKVGRALECGWNVEPVGWRRNFSGGLAQSSFPSFPGHVGHGIVSSLVSGSFALDQHNQLYKAAPTPGIVVPGFKCYLVSAP